MSRSKWEWEWHSCTQCFLVFCIRVRNHSCLQFFLGLLHLHRCIMTHCAALFVALRDELWTFWTVNLATKYQQQRSILNKACGSMLDSEFCRVLWQFVRRILRINSDANTFTLNFVQRFCSTCWVTGGNSFLASSLPSLSAFGLYPFLLNFFVYIPAKLFLQWWSPCHGDCCVISVL